MATAKPSKPRPSLTALRVWGYKSIADPIKISIRPLTVLAGANSSGKSSMLQPALLLKQTLDATYDPGPLMINGPHVRYTRIEQLLSRMSPRATSDEFAAGFELDGNRSVTVVFQNVAGAGLDVGRMEFSEPTNPNRELRAGMASDGVKTAVEQSVPADVRQIFQEAVGVPRWEVTRERCFLQASLHSASDQSVLPSGPHLSVQPGRLAAQVLHQIIHLPGLRGNPERNYAVSAVGTTFPGTFERYAASVIQEWSKADNSALKGLTQDLTDLNLTWKVEAKSVDEVQVELRVGRLTRPVRGGAHDLVSIADVGFGVSQTLPLVVALHAAQPSQVVVIEQPEIHLHPKAQATLADVLIRATKRGVRVIVETHSAMLLLALQGRIADQTISNEDVAMHWFQRNAEGQTEVKTADVDRDGAFGDWPEDFSTTLLNQQDAYLTAVEANHARR